MRRIVVEVNKKHAILDIKNNFYRRVDSSLIAAEACVTINDKWSNSATNAG